jgi:mandelate racemase
MPLSDEYQMDASIKMMSKDDAQAAETIILDSLNVEIATTKLPSPLLTASGALEVASLVVVEVESRCGVKGQSYLFSPNKELLPALAHSVSVAFEQVKGRSCIPELNTDFLLDKFKLFGGTGILTMAFAAIDMATWDLLGNALHKPLYQLLGGSNTEVLSYESSGLSIGTVSQVLSQAQDFVANGNTRMKVRLGYETVEQEINLIRELREHFSYGIEIMVDYNQALSVDQAFERCTKLDGLELLWIEEPILADMLEVSAELTRAIDTPIQIGENLWSLTEFERALNLRSSKYLMPDVAKIGGATQWLRAAKRAEIHGVKVSSHLYPEISSHLLASIDNAHYLEYADWTKLQFSGHISPSNNNYKLTETWGVDFN